MHPQTQTQPRPRYRGHSTYQKHTQPAYNHEYHIGHGPNHLGTVDAVTDATTAKLKPYSLKSIALSRNPQRRQTSTQTLLSEIAHLKDLHHKHLTALIATFTHEDPYNPTFGIVTAPLAECDLEDYFGSFWDEKSKQYQAFAAGWFECLVSGLEYLHRNGVVHGRVKPRNILVREGEVLFTDFGIERKRCEIKIKDPTGFGYEGYEGTSTGRVTVDYAAPEVLAQEFAARTMTKTQALTAVAATTTQAADIFSLAAIFLEILIVYLTPNALDAFRARLAKTQASMTVGHKHKGDKANMHLSYSSQTTLAMRIVRGTVIGSGSPITGELNSVLDLCEEMLNTDPHARPTAAGLGWCWTYGHFLPPSSCGVTHYPWRYLPKANAEPVIGTRIETATASVLEQVLEAHEWAKARAIVWLNKVPLHDGRLILQMARDRNDKEVLKYLERNLINNF
ncbi:protein kinase family protein [Aspergillus mulundensis]|uniref:Protein kinase domain-containing protein n=1 Tax=Aspergillus mulundensis TaxID=1810919 RepID=A0A3D8QVK7_9EURO|nr:Uncharacterized protein DSM5745_09595 [Aspergillus mulundensis]RDW65856.1 Uncharacterized protein DSM5745_09595 [Aspergillus mulundensis]